MEHMTPQDLFVIIGISLACLVGVVLWQFREVVLHFFGALWDRYFTVDPVLWASPDNMSTQVEPVALQKEIPVSNTDTDTSTKNPDTARIASDLTYLETVVLLAMQKNEKGKPKYSGKKIYALVGGNYNDFCRIMTDIREGKDVEPAEQTTPIVGRPTVAQFEPVRRYPWDSDKAEPALVE